MVFAIIDHIMQGTLAGTDAWFQNPASQVSAQYGIGKLGEIHQYVLDENVAWHAGEVANPTAEIVTLLVGVNPNEYTIGIEHEGVSGDPTTRAQFQSSLWLHQQLLTKFRILPSSNRIIRHSSTDALHGGCPGLGFPLNYLIQTLKEQDPWRILSG